ncbi:hypothetical protein QFW96_22710 [Saccharopolyspora sp. TS4A08]|uniref:DUF418 domain-containing protein n=1 Tax=Saccharopolyspora ipomoeae TaxID=3042027 RepID=A0ABT6PTX7_9PSEU|nr:hypothetical protein [Saccharopolyspora sp. TS4A08]MDI2031458.1 hypothetical protein [Saccharopolyspora sp. TS4A08]
MLTDDLSREVTPEQRSASPARLLGRVATTLGFTAVQVWAFFELASLHASGPVLVALVVVMAAAFLVTVEAWMEIRWFASAALRTPTDSGGDRN